MYSNLSLGQMQGIPKKKKGFCFLDFPDLLIINPSDKLSFGDGNQIWT